MYIIYMVWTDTAIDVYYYYRLYVFDVYTWFYARNVNFPRPSCHSQAFKNFDKDDSGSISRDELAEVDGW